MSGAASFHKWGSITVLGSKWWISCDKFTGQVCVDPETRLIGFAPPVWKRFIGQPIDNLVAWLDKFGVVDLEEL